MDGIILVVERPGVWHEVYILAGQSLWHLFRDAFLSTLFIIRSLSTFSRKGETNNFTDSSVLLSTHSRSFLPNSFMVSSHKWLVRKPSCKLMLVSHTFAYQHMQHASCPTDADSGISLGCLSLLASLAGKKTGRPSA